MDPTNLGEAGWGIIIHEDTPRDVCSALGPLTKLREQQAADRFKVLDYKKGEQTRDWYQRHRVSAGNMDPEIVPYYLLLIGPPDVIPFDFQYLLGVEYAVGRLPFETAVEYENYAARSSRMRAPRLFRTGKRSPIGGRVISAIPRRV
jgi:hypothetical protein